MIESVKSIHITDFKGLNTLVASEDLAPDEATRCENVRFPNIGGFKKRSGRAKYNATSLGANPIKFLTRFYYGSTQKLLAGYTTTLKVGNDANGTFANIKTGLTDGLRFTTVTYKNFCYLANGTDANLRYDGTTCTAWGTAGPGATSMAAAEGVAGALGAGTYNYKVTFLYDGYQESNVNTDATAVTIGASKKIDVSAIPVGATGVGVTARKLYRTEVGGSTYYLVTTIGDNTTTTYTDNTTDADLDTTTSPPTTHDVPPVFKYIFLHQERIYAAGNSTYPSRLYYSAIESVSLPDVYPEMNYRDISPDDGDDIVGITSDLSGVLTLFKKNSIRKLYTNGPPAQWALSAPYSIVGCIAPYTIVQTPRGIVYLARIGTFKKELRIFDGQTSVPFSDKIDTTLQNISDIYIEECVGEYDNGKYLLSYVDKTTGALTNNMLLIYDFQQQKFSIDTNKNIACFAQFYGGDDWGELYGGDSNEGFVYREEAVASAQDVFITLKSEVDSGTFSQTASSGTEQQPIISLVAANLSDDVGAQIASTLTASAASTYSNDGDTAWPSGTWISDVYRIDATSLSYLLWRETLGSYGDCLFWFRVGASSAACQAASWNGPYSDPDGSDISAVTASTYIQVRARLYIEDTAQTATCFLYKDEYVVRINAGLGTVAETEISLIYQTGKLRLNNPYSRKHFRQLRVQHAAAGQTYTIYYRIDSGVEQSFSVDTSSYPTEYTTSFPTAYCMGNTIRFRVDDTSDKSFEIKDFRIFYNDEPISY